MHRIAWQKSSDFHEILYTAAYFELDERHVIKNEKVALDRLRVQQNVFLVVNKKLSCRREAARCFVFVCSQFQHTYSAVFLLLVTAASDLLVHNILLNSVLLSPIVSAGVRPKLPGQTPLGHNLPCFLPFVGRLGSGPRLVGRISSGVRVSVSFQQKIPAGFFPTMSYVSRKRSYDQGGCVRGGG